MKIEKNKSLLNLNTLKVDAYSRFFAAIHSINDLEELFNIEIFSQNNKLILGGGSNILFTKNFDGLIIHSAIQNIELIEENKQHVYIKVGSGVEWDDFVSYCVERNWGGVENLSDIPGKVGASPVQNIGAYGIEAKDTIYKVYAYNLKNGERKVFSNSACNFGYRYSIFKQNDFKLFFITHVVFKLNKNPVLQTGYGRVEEEMKKQNNHSIQTLRKVITEIRQSKLPSVKTIASAGSFFKNPVVEQQLANHIKKDNPLMPEFKVGNGMIKIPAAWLIEQCGLKGISNGKVSTFKFQPLVIINLGQATGREIAEFSELIQARVKEKFNIELEPEVCFV